MNRISPALVAAGLLCGAAVLGFGAALVGALDVAPLPPAEAAVESAAPALATSERALSTAALALAVENDPFRADRQRAPDRYRLPGEEEPTPPSPPPPPPPPPPFRLIGTAMTPTGALAVIQVENSTRILEVGESLLGYELTAVEQERATLVNPDRMLNLPLTSAVVTSGAADQNRGRAGGRGAQPQPGRQDAAQAARELIERVRQSGGQVTPQMLEMLQRLQAEGRTFEFMQVEPGRMQIRTTRPDTTEQSHDHRNFR